MTTLLEATQRYSVNLEGYVVLDPNGAWVRFADIEQAIAQEQPASKDAEALGMMYLTLTDAMGYDSGKDGLEWSPEEWAAQLLKSHKAQIKAQQEQPAQEPVAWLHGTTFQVVVSKNRPNSLAAWLPLFAHPAPTQPALSESVIEELAVKHEAFGFGRVDAKGFTTHGFDPDGLIAFAKELIEAHCRGGAK